MSKTNMYFENNSDLAHDRRELSVELLGQSMQFHTDAGVFSKSSIDYGTRVLLDSFTPSGKNLLDVGCGYGVLGLTLAKKYALTATLVDVNARALELTEKNTALNQLTDIEILESDKLSALTGQVFDDIVTNPPIRAGKSVVHGILSESYAHLSAGGALWVVIQKKQGAPSALTKLTEIFGNCDIIEKNKGYWILRSIKK
ncbi:MAG: class I SAM-dependent methyltransferase [Streptococcaceae bacterium]|jgi:16S rRNA (guanine1207-N2)-methyltransferase|nr:class I SAM-dependent methyltransferase [Streptococcaceae bacterium]